MRLAQLGYRGVLVLLSGLGALAGAASCVYGPAPLYGVDLTCDSDQDCTKSAGTDWYCDVSKHECVQRKADAGTGTPDSGK